MTLTTPASSANSRLASPTLSFALACSFPFPLSSREYVCRTLIAQDEKGDYCYTAESSEDEFDYGFKHRSVRGYSSEFRVMRVGGEERARRQPPSNAGGVGRGLERARHLFRAGGEGAGAPTTSFAGGERSGRANNLFTLGEVKRARQQPLFARGGEARAPKTSFAGRGCANPAPGWRRSGRANFLLSHVDEERAEVHGEHGGADDD